MADRAQRDTHLTRIRDNQRRSRARRKEYVEELEAKWRDCQTAGIEASTQIQAAARRVLEDNKRLRQLLTSYGISDPETDAPTTRGNGESEGQKPTAAEALEAMLRVKWSCDEGAPSQVFQMGPMPTLAGRSSDVPTPPLDLSSPHQTPPSSFESGTGGGCAAGEIQPQQYLLPPPAPPQTRIWLPQDITMSTEGLQQMNSLNSSSCFAVADAVRTMRPDTGRELEDAMGCGDEDDCSLANSMALELIDRYS